MNENEARELEIGDCLTCSWDNSVCQVSGFIVGSYWHPRGVKLYWKDNGKSMHVDFKHMSKYELVQTQRQKRLAEAGRC